MSGAHKFKSKIYQMFRRQPTGARGKFIALSACVKSHLVVSNSAIPLDGPPPGSSVHGILHARTLQWVAIYSSRRSSKFLNQKKGIYD